MDFQGFKPMTLYAGTLTTRLSRDPIALMENWGFVESLRDLIDHNAKSVQLDYVRLCDFDKVN